jgi:hypothetical protein
MLAVPPTISSGAPPRGRSTVARAKQGGIGPKRREYDRPAPAAGSPPAAGGLRGQAVEHEVRAGRADRGCGGQRAREGVSSAVPGGEGREARGVEDHVAVEVRLEPGVDLRTKAQKRTGWTAPAGPSWSNTAANAVHHRLLERQDVEGARIRTAGGDLAPPVRVPPARRRAVRRVRAGAPRESHPGSARPRPGREAGRGAGDLRSPHTGIEAVRDGGRRRHVRWARLCLSPRPVRSRPLAEGREALFIMKI